MAASLININDTVFLTVIKQRFGRVVALVGLLSIAPWLAAELQVDDGYVRGLPPGQVVTAAFMTLRNDAEQAVSIVSASSDSAEQTEIHAHVHNNGMMRMEKVDSITVPAKGRFVLAPGEHHLMLINLSKPLKQGDQVTIALSLGDGSIQTVQLPVISVLNEHHH